MKFLDDLRKRHRGEIVFMIWILAVLSILTGAFVLHLFRPDPAKPPTELSREWGTIILLALPWATLAVFYKKFREHRVRHGHPERSIRASVEALLDESRTQSVRYKWAGRLNVAVALLLPLVAYQLRIAGKAGDEIVAPACVVAPMVLLAICAAMLRYRRRVLLPRQQELQALLITYRETEAAS